VSSFVPFLVFILVIVGLLAFSARARRRQAQVQLERAEKIGIGTEVMTTSGLYGTVVARNDDDSVLLSIAPGVEVRWALAALRDLESLPREYRGDRDGADAGAEADADETP
jgi:preprotein translocase subunit YajC